MRPVIRIASRQDRPLGSAAGDHTTSGGESPWGVRSVWASRVLQEADRSEGLCVSEESLDCGLDCSGIANLGFSASQIKEAEYLIKPRLSYTATETEFDMFRLDIW